MRGIAIRIGLIFALLFAAVIASRHAHAQNAAVADMTPAGALTGSELFYCLQGGSDRKCTGNQIGALITIGQTGYFFANGGSLPSFSPTIPVGNLGSIAANTIVGNFNVGPGAPAARTINGGASCLTALTYTNGTGFGCSGATASVFVSVQTLAALRALTTATFTDKVTMVFVNGANSVNDGGGGMYMFTASAPIDNGGTLIASNNAGGYIWQNANSTQPISPQVFGAKCDGATPGQISGATDDTTAFTNMMAWLNNVGGGTVQITGNCYLASEVPLLHNSAVTWIGFGDFYRTSGLPFYPNPTNTQASANTLFASQSGNDNNDGLSATAAIKTIQNYVTIVSGYNFHAGVWTLKLAAGSYPGFTMYSNMCSGPDPNSGTAAFGHIQIEGPQPTGTTLGRNVLPTANIDGALGQPPGQTYGVGLEGADCLYLSNIGIVDWSLEGMFVGALSDLYAVNVWLYNDGSFGAEARQSNVVWVGGTCDGSAGGVTQICLALLNGTSFTIESQNSLNTSLWSPTFQNAAQVGVLVQEEASGHCDYCTSQGNQYGFEVANGAHIQVDFSNILNNTGAMMFRGLSSTWLNLSNTVTGNGNGNATLTFTDTSP